MVLFVDFVPQKYGISTIIRIFAPVFLPPKGGGSKTRPKPKGKGTFNIKLSTFN